MRGMSLVQIGIGTEMISKTKYSGLGFAVMGLGMVCSSLVDPVSGQVTAPAVIAQGEVMTNDVYVRSGPSLNYYPVSKMQAGDRVQIVSEREEWYQILPPAQTFSLIHEDYVDTVDGKVGVVNGDNVLVRAGSSLPEWSKQKYARQALLSKGARVSIVGKSPEGFMQIEPPVGVTVWIHRSLIHPVTGDLINAEKRAVRPVELTLPTGDREVAIPTDLGSKPQGGAVDGLTSAASPTESSASALAALPATANRKSLIEIDESLKSELAKPVLQRDLSKIEKSYQTIADVQDDELARDYASARLDQLAHMTALIDAVKQMHRLDEHVESQRIKFMEERASNRYGTLPTAQAGLDAQGELRPSALYPPGSEPRRFRLVDRASDRTIGYVELPTESTLDVDSFIGRYVGVRASQKRLLAGGVNPVPIYVASELTLLRPAAEAQGPS